MDIIDDDAYVIGLSLFPPSTARCLTTKAVHTMAATMGIKLGKSRSTDQALTSIGHILYTSGKVKLLKSAGLTRKDVIFT